MAKVFLVGKSNSDGEIIVASRMYFTETEANAKARLWSRHEPDCEYRVFETEIEKYTTFKAGKKQLFN